MIGVLGCSAALDGYFIETFRKFAKAARRRGVFYRFSEKTVEFVGEFYNFHREEIDNLAAAYQTVAFETGRPTGRRLPAAKVIDIYGFNASFNP